MKKNYQWKVSVIIGMLFVAVQCTPRPLGYTTTPTLAERELAMEASTPSPMPTVFVIPTSILDGQLPDDLVFVDTDLDDWKSYTVTHNSDLKQQTFNSIVIAPDENIWIGGSNGVALFNGSDWTSFFIPSELLSTESNYHITSISVDNSNSVWTAGRGSSVYRFKEKSWTKELDQKSVSAMEANPQDGILWFTFDYWGGAMKYDGGNWLAYTDEDGLLSNQVLDVTFDAKGTTWFVTDDGISSFDGKTWNNYPLELFCSSPSCYTDGLFANIAIGPDETLWFTLRSAGLFHYSTSEQWERYYTDLIFQDSFPVSSMCFTPDGKLWMGKWSQHSVTLFYFQDGQWHIPRIKNMDGTYTIPFGRINDIACASDNSIWFVSASNAGILHYTPGIVHNLD